MSWRKSSFSGQQPCCVQVQRNGDAIEFSDSKHQPSDGGPVLSFPPSTAASFFRQIEAGRKTGFSDLIQVEMDGENYLMGDLRGGPVLTFYPDEMQAFCEGVCGGEFTGLLDEPVAADSVLITA